MNQMVFIHGIGAGGAPNRLSISSTTVRAASRRRYLDIWEDGYGAAEVNRAIDEFLQPAIDSIEREENFSAGDNRGNEVFKFISVISVTFCKKIPSIPYPALAPFAPLRESLRFPCSFAALGSCREIWRHR